jgi:hypothetical protein
VRVEAIEGAREYLRHGGLAGAACAAEQIGMTHRVGFERVAQGFHHMALLHHILEGHGAPFSVQGQS